MLDAFFSNHCRVIPLANGQTSAAYLRKSRRGSWHSRKIHSTPPRCIQTGARFTLPARKSIVAPTDTITGPSSSTYHVGALKAGTYYFQCDVHPGAMNGTFIVK